MRYARGAMVVAVLAAACSSKSTSKSKPDEPAEMPAQPVPAVATPATGDGELAVMSLALWPDRWSAVRSAVAKLEAAGGATARGAIGELPLASGWTIPAQLFGALGWSEMTAPLDVVRGGGPIVIEVLPAPARFEEVALAGFTSNGAVPGSLAMWPRIRVTLPTESGDALATAVFERAKTAGMTELANSVYASDSLLVRATTFPTAVVLDLVSGAGLASLDDDTRDAHLGAPPSRPAQPAFERDRQSALRFVLRAEETGDLGASSGIIKTVGAAEGADAAMKKFLILEGTSEVMVAYLMMDPAASIADAVVIDVPAGADATPQLALVLSSAGAAVADAAGLADGKRVAISAIDWDAALAKTKLSAIVQAVETPQDIAELFYECGWGCWTYVMLGNGLQHARKLGVQLAGIVAEARAGAPELVRAIESSSLWRSGKLVVLGADQDVAGLTVSVAPTPSATFIEAAACYRTALVPVRRAFGAVARLDPSQKRAALAEGKAALDSAKACATTDPAIAARYSAMSSLMDAVVAEVSAQ